MARDDTTLEAAGAEHLIVGRLLIDGLQAFRAYASQAGYHLLVIDPSTGRSVKVQVKSRVAVDSGSFRIKSFDFDLVVFVRLNRGTKASRKAGQPEGAINPEFYIVPQEKIPLRSQDGVVRVSKGWLKSHTEFHENWALIKQTLHTVAVVEGVRITIHLKDHLPPHVHAIFSGSEAQISIATGQVLNGNLPKAKLRAVLAWLDAHREQVAYIWTEIRAKRYYGGMIE